MPPAPTPATTPLAEPLRDKHGRAITDLRLSVTDRCNYRCVYCRAGDGAAPFTELSLDELLRLSRIFVSLGIQKIRLTGGEPLLRRDLLDLVRSLAALRTPTGDPLEIALTTNGHLLAPVAQPLRDAGLSRITISMDAVDPEAFARITRVPGSYTHVLAGLRAAQAAGFQSIKINAVLLRGFNDDQIEPFAALARSEQVIVRFIEFMPLEEDRVWSPQVVVPLREILSRLNRIAPLVELPPNHPFAPDLAAGLRGEIGIIAPVSQPFCGHCSRIRLTSDGKLRTCLFSQSDHDLHGLLQRGTSDADLAAHIRRIVDRKEERHHIGEPGFQKPSRSMVHIGG